MLGVDNKLLLLNCESYCTLPQMMVMAESTGTDVKKGFRIIEGNAFPLLKLDGLALFNEVVGIPNVVEGNALPEDIG